MAWCTWWDKCVYSIGGYIWIRSVLTHDLDDGVNSSYFMVRKVRGCSLRVLTEVVDMLGQL